MFSLRYWIFFLVVIVAVGFSMLRLNQDDTLITSPSDPYSYQHMRLLNGMKVLLVHTPDSEKAAAAVTVDVGSGDDPIGREGLAHFLEHMLFLGTDAYPEPGEYQAFISRHGGSFNAFTAYQQTTYFFDIDNGAFSEALDRFAPFFISPRFDEAYVEREKNAVNAEYRAKYNDDFRRIYSAEKQALNPNHPFASFSVGSLDTLADRDGHKLHDDLLMFYHSHYSADRMTLVLAGNYPLEQLAAWATQYFAAVSEHTTLPHRGNEPLFTPGQLPLEMNIEPIKEIRRLQFSFPLPASRSLYPAKPDQMLSNLLGHEGEGSLLAFLKAKGWAEGLSAGRSLSSAEDNLLVVQVQLTRQGLLQVDRITQALLHYIELLKQEPLPAYLLKEQQQLNELAFHFQEQPRLTDMAVRLSTNLLFYPAKDSLYGDYRFGNINPKQWQPFLNALNANNMLRTLIAPKVATDTLDPWYETPLRIRPLNYQADADFTAELSALHLPAVNPFIPQDFELHAEPVQATPSLLSNEANRQLWYYPEHDFKLPKARVIIQLQQAQVQSSAKQRVLAQLYVRAINEALNTYSYPASLAGLNYNLVASNRGLDIALSGYQDKLPVLLERILEQTQTLELHEDQFDRYRASIVRRLENQLKNLPYERAMVELNHWLYNPSFSEQELLAALDTVTLAEVQDFARDFKQNLSTLVYVHGSLSHKQAQAVASLVERFFPAHSPRLPQPSLLKVPSGEHQLNMQLSHNDKVFTLYVQGQNNSDRERARFALLGQIISSPYYERLRTEEQLGYIVFATQYPQQTIPALAFIVQSPHATPEQILTSSKKFFAEFEPTLAKLTPEEFASFQQGLTTMLTEKPKNMSEKVVRFMRDIEVQRTGFDTNSAIAAEVNKLTLDDIKALYHEAIISQQLPWLAITQGGSLTHWRDINTIKRTEQPSFVLGNEAK